MGFFRQLYAILWKNMWIYPRRHYLMFSIQAFVLAYIYYNLQQTEGLLTKRLNDSRPEWNSLPRDPEICFSGIKEPVWYFKNTSENAKFIQLLPSHLQRLNDECKSQEIANTTTTFQACPDQKWCVENAKPNDLTGYKPAYPLILDFGEDVQRQAIWTIFVESPDEDFMTLAEADAYAVTKTHTRLPPGVGHINAAIMQTIMTEMQQGYETTNKINFGRISIIPLLTRGRPTLGIRQSNLFYYSIISLMFFYPMVTRLIEERSSGGKELLSIMGMSDLAYFIANILGTYVTGYYALVLILYHEMYFTNPTIKISVIYPLFFLALAFMNLCLMVVLLQLFFVSATSGVVVMCVFLEAIRFLPTMLIGSSGDAISTPFFVQTNRFIKLGCAVSPLFGFFLVESYFVLHDRYTNGTTYDYLTASLTDYDDVIILDFLIVMIVELIVILFLIFYFNNILSWVTVSPKGWFFFLSPYYYFPAIAKNKAAVAATNNEANIEPELAGLEAVVECLNVTKIFGSHQALRSVSMKMFLGEITILLGQSGAGKTTLMNVITGLSPPTFGDVFVCGFHINKSRSLARKKMSFCQQQSVYYSDMSVYEHLVFYSMIINLPPYRIHQESMTAIRMVNLYDKTNELAENLSGGMKRRLCVAVAVLGRPKVIVLDEPSAGLDAETRREIWDLLLEIRRQRCIIMSTHDMEEADVLGDRIAVIANGVLGCYGSPYFLKKKFGSGYSLRILKTDENCKTTEILEIAQEVVPECSLASETDKEFIISLKIVDAIRCLELFRFLESKKQSLGIEAFGVTVTTIEDVFLNFLESEVVSQEIKEQQDVEVVNIKQTRVIELMARRDRSNYRIWIALLHKRIAYFTASQWILFCMTAVVYTALVYGTSVGIDAMSSADFKELLDVSVATVRKSDYHLSLSNPKFEDAGVYLQADPHPFVENYLIPLLKQQTKNLVLVPNNTDIETYVLNATKKIPYHTLLPQLAMAIRLFGNATIYINDDILGMEMIAYQLFHTAMLRYILGREDTSFETYIKLYQAKRPKSTSSHKKTLQLSDELQEDMEAVIAKAMKHTVVTMMSFFLLPLAFSILISSFVLMPIIETASQAKELQLLTGCREWLYYLGHLTFDVLLFFGFLSLFGFIFVSQFVDLTNFECFLTFLVLTVMYSVPAISMAYIVSHLTASQGIGYSLMLMGTYMIHVVVGAFEVAENMEFAEQMDIYDMQKTRGKFDRFISPTGTYVKAILRMIAISSQNQLCLNLSNDLYSAMCNMSDMKLLSGECCNSSRALSPILTDSYMLTFMFYIGLLGAGYFNLLLMMEKGLIKKWNEPTSAPLPNIELDDDVVKEQQLAFQLIKDKNFEAEQMIVFDLRKKFPNILAVAGLSFVVHPNECFGLLGVNGAGKTTTFQMLTGFIPATSGDAFIKGDSMRRNVKVFQSHLGYCPQYNGLLLRLTVKQMFYLFGVLRGVPDQDIENIIEDLVDLLELREHIKKYCEELSGGNKRKLSMGLAIIGQPELVFLDEPTAGVDVIAKKRIFAFIRFMQEKAKIAVVLTSHGMNECEATCDRIGIMVQGQFRCIGSLQHIKNKFGSGFTFNVKVTPEQRDDPAYGERLVQDVTDSFGNASLKSKHLGIFLFHIEISARRSWTDLFEKAIKLQEALQFEDFLLMDTTLQEIFCDFAKGTAIQRIKLNVEAEKNIFENDQAEEDYE